jgi:hypothetical protein
LPLPNYLNFGQIFGIEGEQTNLAYKRLFFWRIQFSYESEADSPFSGKSVRI